MTWYVSYGSGRALHALGQHPMGSGWTMQQCSTEKVALGFAIERAAEGLVIQAVGEIGSEDDPKYRHAQIVSLMKDAEAKGNK